MAEQTRRIAILIGSLRKGSYNRMAAHALIALSPNRLKARIVEIGNLPLYDQDADDTGRPPLEWTQFREAIAGCDAVLFVTPEYNRSVPGVLKNAIDIGSRPYGQSVWNGKPAAIMSLSLGGIGAFGANHHLRQSLVFLNMPVMQQPEAYVGYAANLFSDTGEIVNDNTRTFFKSFIDAYAEWIARIIGDRRSL